MSLQHQRPSLWCTTPVVVQLNDEEHKAHRTLGRCRETRQRQIINIIDKSKKHVNLAIDLLSLGI